RLQCRRRTPQGIRVVVTISRSVGGRFHGSHWQFIPNFHLYRLTSGVLVRGGFVKSNRALPLEAMTNTDVILPVPEGVGVAPAEFLRLSKGNRPVALRNRQRPLRSV